MKSLVEAAIAIFIVWLFIEYKNSGRVHVAGASQGGGSFQENPSNGYGTPATLSTLPQGTGSGATGGGCGCGGGSSSGGGRNPNPIFPVFSGAPSPSNGGGVGVVYAGSLG